MHESCVHDFVAYRARKGSNALPNWCRLCGKPKLATDNINSKEDIEAFVASLTPNKNSKPKEVEDVTE